MNIRDYLTPEIVQLAAKELVETFAQEANEKTLEVDFKLKNGLMEINYPDNVEVQNALVNIHGEIVPQANTHLSFNATSGSKLAEIKDYFCELIEKDEINDEDYALIQKFVKNIIISINTSADLLAIINNKIRNLNKIDEETFALEKTKLILFEFGHKEDYGDMIKVLNYSRYNKVLQSFVGEKRAVAKDLLLKRREFGYDSKISTREIYAHIIEQQKKAQNPLYDDLLIEDVQIVKEAKEYHMDIFIDYSPRLRENMEIQINKDYK